MLEMDDPEAFLRRLFDAALRTADPHRLMLQNLPEKPHGGRTLIVGVGKAAAAMALAFEEAWGDEAEGLVVVPDGYGLELATIEVLKAGHPVPDQRGIEAAAKVVRMAEGLEAGDTLIALISGGGSALLPAPRGEITLAEKQQITEALLHSGAPISQINLVRQNLSRTKGGGLLRSARPARTLTFIISDVPGDDIAQVASGPTIMGVEAKGLALDILGSHGIEVLPSVAAVLSGDDENDSCEEDPGSNVIVIGSARLALDGAQRVAREAGAAVIRLGDSLEGEARDLAAEHGELVLDAARADGTPRPVVFLSGGEVTVRIRGSGRGGPNMEYLLALAIGLGGHADVWALAADTDGLDGDSGAAGAIVGPKTMSVAKGLDPAKFLDANDSATFFEAAGGTLRTGPTRTNVNDFRAILLV
jgi:hydroxypyruvate reductase